jgi:hypothetical protein
MYFVNTIIYVGGAYADVAAQQICILFSLCAAVSMICYVLFPHYEIIKKSPKLNSGIQGLIIVGVLSFILSILRPECRRSRPVGKGDSGREKEKEEGKSIKNCLICVKACLVERNSHPSPRQHLSLSMNLCRIYFKQVGVVKSLAIVVQLTSLLR